jgi:hypothetical protein
MIDNWLLQDVSLTLNNGLSTEMTSQIIIDHKKNNYSYGQLPKAAVQIECIINFLVDLVTRDNLIFDKEYSYVWNNFPELMNLNKEGIISPYEVDATSDSFLEGRKFALSNICVNEEMKKTQKMNEDAWESKGETDDPLFSQTIWGTAGNLSRSNLLSAPYSPHPIRKMVLQQTLFKESKPDVVKTTSDWINSERVRIFSEVRPDITFNAAQVILQPIAVEIIESCTDVKDLFSVALQMRKRYKRLRKFLGDYQAAIDSEEPKAIMKCKKTIGEVHEIVASNNSAKFGSTSISIGIGFVSVGLPLPKFAHRFGIRATLQKIIFQDKGEATLKKLLSMLDMKNAVLSEGICNHFKK